MSPVTGKPFAAQFPAVGGRPPYRWTVSGGKLPTGYTLDDNGEFHGTTTDTGAYRFELTATDAQGTVLSGSLSDTLQTSGTIPFAMGTTTLPSFGEGEDFGFEPFVDGGTPPYTFTVTGLPPGADFDPSTGTLMGRPTASGAFSITYTLKDSLGNVASNSPMSMAVTVVPPQPAGGVGSGSSGSGTPGSGGGPCQSGELLVSGRSCVPLKYNGMGQPNGPMYAGADNHCLSPAEWSTLFTDPANGTAQPFPTVCGREGKTACVFTGPGGAPMVTPCCPGLICRVSSTCGDATNAVGGTCMR
jgi:hypothetical protein